MGITRSIPLRVVRCTLTVAACDENIAKNLDWGFDTVGMVTASDGN